MCVKQKEERNGFDGNDFLMPRYLLWGGVKNCKIILKLIIKSTYEINPLKKLHLFV